MGSSFTQGNYLPLLAEQRSVKTWQPISVAFEPLLQEWEAGMPVAPLLLGASTIPPVLQLALQIRGILVSKIRFCNSKGHKFLIGGFHLAWKIIRRLKFPPPPARTGRCGRMG